MNPWENVALWVQHQKAMGLALDAMELYANTEDESAIQLAEKSLAVCEYIIVKMAGNAADS